MKSWARILIIALAIITVLSLLLSACGPLEGGGNDPDNGNAQNKDKGKDKGSGNDKDKPGKVSICHKTGSSQNPYVELSVANAAVTDGHNTHEGDIIPAPEGGCPSE